MPSYDSGTALIDAIIRKGNKFIIEFGDIPDQYWDTLQPDVDDRTPRQMLREGVYPSRTAKALAHSHATIREVASCHHMTRVQRS